MIVLSCGHEVETFDEGIPAITKHYDEEGKKCLSYSLMCRECYDYNDTIGFLFRWEEEAKEWLKND